MALRSGGTRHRAVEVVVPDAPPPLRPLLRELADELDLVFIVDEIATGFGRTGKWFASEWADVVPDVMCVGKALTGGYMTLAAVLVSAAVGEVITASEQRALMHGPTFMANPLACAVALQSVRMLRETWSEDVARLSAALSEILPVAADLSVVKDVRAIGGVGVVEFHEAPDPALLTRTALEQGVWFRPFGRLLYTMPPYVCTDDEVAQICDASVAIPMRSGLRSLNVAMAAAMVVGEALRQLGAYPTPADA